MAEYGNNGEKKYDRRDVDLIYTYRSRRITSWISQNLIQNSVT